MARLGAARAMGFAQKDQLELYRARDEITLSVGPYRRNIALPDELLDLEITSAKFEDHTLNIRFEGRNKLTRKLGFRAYPLRLYQRCRPENSCLAETFPPLI